MAASVQDLLLAAQSKQRARNPLGSIMQSFLQGGIDQHGRNVAETDRLTEIDRVKKVEDEKIKRAEAKEEQKRKRGEETVKRMRDLPGLEEKTKVGPLGGVTSSFAPIKAGTDARDILKNAYDDASRQGWFSDSYFQTFESLGAAAGIPVEQMPTRGKDGNPVPPGLLENIYKFEQTPTQVPGAGGDVAFEDVNLIDHPKNRAWFSGLTPAEKQEVLKTHGRK